MRVGISETLNGFQSTPPERGATGHHRLSEIAKVISIHAPRAGSDAVAPTFAALKAYFNPRPPSGERHKNRVAFVHYELFQSTPPERGATEFVTFVQRVMGISIHAPRAGSDIPLWMIITLREIFQSTPPERGATIARQNPLRRIYPFQSTPPERGATS